MSNPSAAALGRAIRDGHTDPRDLVEAGIAAAEARPDIVAHVTADRARRAAAAAADRAKRGLLRGPLDGVPISWKDLFDIAGAPTRAGSELLADAAPPTRDAEVVARGDRAGLPPLCKTHMSELAFSGLGVNPVTATPPNAVDPARAPGGSSSGAAASVALGLAPAAIGSDTGGSVRIPAAWNGLVGLKTTAGLIPNDGVVPLAPTLDTVGPLTRTVEDTALLFAMLTETRPVDLAGGAARRASVLVAETTVFEDMPDDRRAAFEAAVDAIATLGVTVTRGPIPEFPEILEVAGREGALVNTQGYAVWRDRIEAAPDKIWSQIRERFRSGAAHTGDQAERGRLAFARLQRSYLARAAGVDAVIAPTTPTPPPLTQRLLDDPDYYVAQNLLALRNTRLGNLLGLSALTLPAGRDAAGLPCGLMLMGPSHAEARLLRLGALLEPPLSAL